MSTRSLGNVALLVVVAALAGRAEADDIDYSKTPLVDWSQETQLFDQCTAMGKLGTPTCNYDQASFDKHYAQEKTKKLHERDRSYPHSYCQMAVGMLNGNAAMSNFFHELAEDAPAKAFKSRVQEIKCVYDDSKSSPSLKLVKNTLVITARWKNDEDPPGLMIVSDWYIRDLAAIFPEFKAVWHAKHPDDRI